MYTYIVIDDESLIRKGTIKKLQPMEEQITCIGEADNGKAGIELIQEVHPDIVILDMQMPIMGGKELLPYLAESYPDMPLIVISGYRDFDYVKQAISAAAIDYILKPFSKEAIQDCISRAIERLEDSQTLSRVTDSDEEKEAAYYDYDIQHLTNLILGYHVGEGSISSKRLNFINDTHQLVLLTLYFESPSQIQEVNIQHWLEDGGFTYYLDVSGRRMENTVWNTEESGISYEYRFDLDGHLILGWYEEGDETYYYYEKGLKCTGISIIEGETYYFDENGKSITLCAAPAAGCCALPEHGSLYTDASRVFPGL